MKPLSEMTTEELTEALAALDRSRPEDTALRLALHLELRRAAAEEWLNDDAHPHPPHATESGERSDPPEDPR